MLNSALLIFHRLNQISLVDNCKSKDLFQLSIVQSSSDKSLEKQFDIHCVRGNTDCRIFDMVTTSSAFLSVSSIIISYSRPPY